MRDEKVEFVTIKAEELSFGKNNFLEVAYKKAVSERGTNEFVSVSRGFVNPEGQKRFRSSVSMPVDMAGKAADLLKNIAAGAPSAAPAEEATEETTEQ